MYYTPQKLEAVARVFKPKGSESPFIREETRRIAVLIDKHVRGWRNGTKVEAMTKWSCRRPAS